MAADIGRTQARRLWVAGVSAVLAFVGLLIFLSQRPDSQLDRLDKLSSAAGLIIAVAGLGVSIMSLVLAVRGLAADPAVLLEQAASDLAVQVRRQWRDELHARGMGHLDPIRLRWSTTDRPVMPSPAEIIGADRLPLPPTKVTRLRLAGDIDDMARTLTLLPSRQLVMIGAPGAGKSTLAVLLTLGLLDRRQAGAPVPVLLTLTSWNPNREHLDTWLVRRLGETYPTLRSRRRYNADAATWLVETGLILPVLDGLDEMPEPVQAEAITALTAAVGQDRPLVLTSRSEEYQAAVRRAGSPLARAAVVEIEPVTTGAAAIYLPAGQIQGQDRWRPVLVQLAAAPDGVLARALRTPLMVYLARVAYQAPDGPDPTELLAFSHPDAIETHLLNAYLPAVYARRTPPPPGPDRVRWRSYEPQQAQQWLTFLAVHFTQQGTTDLAWWRLRDAVPHFRVVLGLAAGLTHGFAFWFVVGPMAGLAAGLLIPLAYAFMTAAMAKSEEGRIRPRQTTFDFNVYRLAGHVFNRLVLLSGSFGLALGIGEGFVLGDDAPLGRGINYAIGSMLLAWSQSFVRAGMGVPVGVAPAVTPASTLASDRMVGVFTLVVFGPILALSMLTTGVEAGFAFGLAVGTAAGLLGADLLVAWPSFVVIRALLAARGRIPYDLVRFLDDAHHRGVLRQAGAVYQFRHVRLQRHLAESCHHDRHVPPAEEPLTVMG